MLLGVPCISTEVGESPACLMAEGTVCGAGDISCRKSAENDKYASDASESKNNTCNYKTTKHKNWKIL